MGQTDRQTDKATHWKTAVFDVHDNWAHLEATPPSFIKWVKSKKEICPTTGKEHYQIHVCCNKQVRLTQMCSYIKHTKWFAVLGEQHIKNSIAYIEKEETTAPGAKVEVIQGEKYLRTHELLLEIAKYYEWELIDYRGGKHSQNTWARITSRMIAKDIMWANKLCNPALRRMWEDWEWVFTSKVAEYCEETSGAFIIEGTASEGLPEEEDGYGFVDE